MKICAYVPDRYAKHGAFKNECLDSRQFMGLKIIIDSLQRAGYTVEWAGIATVHLYDVVLVSLTADCDWWPYIRERQMWKKGNYKVIVGGAGVLHVSPFLPFADYFSLGRGEVTIPNLIKTLDDKGGNIADSIIDSTAFNENNTYKIEQTASLYPHEIPNGTNKPYKEVSIGCDNRCLFCGYTWQRKPILIDNKFNSNGALYESSIMDMMRSPEHIDWRHLRLTAIDGMSERLRMMVNKRISRDMLIRFLNLMRQSDAIPHEIRLFNILGYPSETDDDMMEYLDTIKSVDALANPNSKKWKLVLSSTPFRAMPATPLACAPMSKRNYRGYVSRLLGAGYPGCVIYDGNALWSVEGLGTEHLASVMLSAIAHRGSINDTESIMRLCHANKFWSANADTRQAVLEKLFDMDYLFGEFTPETLPSRYLRTYCAVEKTWRNKPWKPQLQENMQMK